MILENSVNHYSTVLRRLDTNVMVGVINLFLGYLQVKMGYKFGIYASGVAMAISGILFTIIVIRKEIKTRRLKYVIK